MIFEHFLTFSLTLNSTFGPPVVGENGEFILEHINLQLQIWNPEPNFVVTLTRGYSILGESELMHNVSI